MRRKEEKYIQDRRFPKVRTVFMNHLHQRNDLNISSEDAEETFIALWIFLNKKMAEIFAVDEFFFDEKDAEYFYREYIGKRDKAREYLNKLLKSFVIKTPA